MLLFPVCWLKYYIIIIIIIICQYSEGPATGHLDTSFSWFPCA